MHRLIVLAFVTISLSVNAQPAKYSTNQAHSHNDYEQDTPFLKAYHQQFGSLEADIFLENGSDVLWVAHTPAELAQKRRSLDSLYLQPLAQYIRTNKGYVYADTTKRLQLLIDIKTAAVPTLNRLIEVLKQYPDIINCPSIRIVISGGRPDPSVYPTYPSFIWFDGNLGATYTPAALEKIALLSGDWKKFSTWNGKGRILAAEYATVENIVRTAHGLNKPVRFWATPDNINTWYTLQRLQVDYINTDLIEPLADFLKNLDKRRARAFVTHPAYMPSYKTDGTTKPAKNVIVLIGDGMGLPHQYAGYTANNGSLTLFNMRHTGLSKTSSYDHYITDSAPGSTAISSGEKTNNRFVGVDHTGAKLRLIPEIIAPRKLSSAIVTSGDLTDATPADFYAHRAARDSSAAIYSDLALSPVQLIMGSPNKSFNDQIRQQLQQNGFNITSSLDSLPATTTKKWIVQDPAAGMHFAKGRGEWLQKAFAKTLGIVAHNKNGFFIMTEGAQIDHAAHDNDLQWLVDEMLDFDQVVAQALAFADKNGETLVIVTADHETGGLTLLEGDYEKGTVSGQFSTDDHTALPVMVYAYGPGAQLFTGVYENTAIFHKIMKAWGK